MASISVENGVVQSINVDMYYPLADILSTYGQPDEVWVYVHAFTIMGYQPYFVITLFYSKQGILAVYEGSAYPQKIVQVCPYKIRDQRRWYLWNPEYKLNFKGAGNILSLEVKKFRLLEEAAGIDVKNFYETYQDPLNSLHCFSVEDPEYP